MGVHQAVRGLALICFIFALQVDVVFTSEENTEGTNITTAQRSGRLFSVFQVVRFQNQACTGSSSKNGTCYTSTECTSKGGASAGSCASGYGVCCVFALHCGSSSSQNCTYFESTGGETGSCQLKICKCNSNICQLRLDFNTFVISGPSTTTQSAGKEIAGVPASGGKTYTLATDCLTDTFSITNPGGNSPPTICGTNTGYHMYVDASQECNNLAFILGQSAVGTSLASRQWSIKITQYSCDYSNLAPQGCTQYYFGSTTNCVYSYNYAGGVQLGSQDQNICVRKERSYCKICWYAAIATDIQISGSMATTKYAKPSSCCGYGSKGTAKGGFDCLSIPGAAKTMGTELDFQRQCGRNTGLCTGKGTAPVCKKTVCSSQLPFSLRFLSDAFEQIAEGPTAVPVDKGFKLCYFESATNC